MSTDKLDENVENLQNQLHLVQNINQLEQEIKNKMGWFAIIGVLSLINSVLFFLGIQLTFIFGLGITQFIDGFAHALQGYVSPDWVWVVYAFNFGINWLVVMFFIGLTFLGNKKYRSAIIVGILIYIFDAFLVLYFEDYWSFGFHIYALFFLGNGLKHVHQFLQLEMSLPPEQKELFQQLQTVNIQNKTQEIALEKLVRRGILWVNMPVVFIVVLGSLFFYAVSLFNYNVWSDELGVAVMCGGPFIAIFAGVAWWAFHVPRWRRWALAQGADPDKLQKAAEKARLVSKKGSFWEKLEFDVQDKVEG
jgi:hypothetical protein